MILRSYKIRDCKKLINLFYNTVHTVNEKDYTIEQLDVWAPKNIDLRKKNKIGSKDSHSNFHINDSKKSSESTVEKLPVQNDNSVTKLDALENKQNHQPKTNGISATLLASKLDIPANNLEKSTNNKFTETSNHKNVSSGINNKMNNGYVASTSRNNASLPQAESKNNSTILVLAGISSLFTALGLSIFKKKTK